jgi:hypothetical protein
MSSSNDVPSTDCDHPDLMYTGGRDSDGNTLYEVHRCEDCGTRIHFVYQHTHNLIETSDGDYKEVAVSV